MRLFEQLPQWLKETVIVEGFILSAIIILAVTVPLCISIFYYLLWRVEKFKLRKAVRKINNSPLKMKYPPRPPIRKL